jgi:hypothetical protein
MLHSYTFGRGGRRAQELREALKDTPERLKEITKHFLSATVVDGERWLRLNRFREVTLLAVSHDELLEAVLDQHGKEASGSELERFLYEVAISWTVSDERPERLPEFERVYNLAEGRPDLAKIRADAMFIKLPPGYLRHAPRRGADDSDTRITKHRADFHENIDVIRSGTHLGWLAWAAQIYFGLFSDLDESLEPRARLEAALGEENAEAAIAGFIAALSRNDLPDLNRVVELWSKQQTYNWWFALRVGLIERWVGAPGLQGLSDEFLKGMIALDLTNPVFRRDGNTSRVIVSAWKEAVLEDRPELVRDTYLTLARVRLSKGDEIVDGLRELMVLDAFKTTRGEIALALLEEFPNAPRYRLSELLDGVIATTSAHQEFLNLSVRVLGGLVALGDVQRDLWLAVSYLLSPARYEALVEARAGERPSIIFELREHSGYGSFSDRPRFALSLPQQEFLAQLTGRLFPQVGIPSGAAWGDTNGWDAAEFCRKHISAISAVTSDGATAALRRLEADARLKSYNPEIRHAIANQLKLRREAQYDRPDWASSIKSLSNAAPATVADLHALFCQQLRDFCSRLLHENTDIDRFFWNVDGYGRLEEPKPEETCRDALVTLLRPLLAPKGVSIEPEGHMARDKRADLSVVMTARKILCELKRDYHLDLWTAAENQLERFYVHDPNAQGYGVYAVFWFGAARPTRMARHPAGLKTPSSALELQRMLWELVPEERRHRIAIIVIDVAGAELPRAPKRKKASSKKQKKSTSKGSKKKTIKKAKTKWTSKNRKRGDRGLKGVHRASKSTTKKAKKPAVKGVKKKKR